MDVTHLPPIPKKHDQGQETERSALGRRRKKRKTESKKVDSPRSPEGICWKTITSVKSAQVHGQNDVLVVHDVESVAIVES